MSAKVKECSKKSFFHPGGVFREQSDGIPRPPASDGGDGQRGHQEELRQGQVPQAHLQTEPPHQAQRIQPGPKILTYILTTVCHLSTNLAYNC